MRIIAGQFRGLSLASVGKGDVGAHLRPTSDRVRESLFNVLNGYDVLDEAHVLDLFAGTGALGLEALSRGATDATFVDSGGKAAQLIQQNIAMSRTETQTRLIRSDVRKLPASSGLKCDVVFLDPPYGKGLGQIALNVAQARGWIAPRALIVWEENAPQVAPEAFTVLEKTALWRHSHNDYARQWTCVNLIACQPMRPCPACGDGRSVPARAHAAAPEIPHLSRADLHYRRGIAVGQRDHAA